MCSIASSIAPKWRSRCSRFSMPLLPFVLKVFPSDANFLLVRTTDADGIYRFLIERSVIVRNRNRVSKCLGCLRITVGTPDENNDLIKNLKEYGK